MTTKHYEKALWAKSHARQRQDDVSLFRHNCREVVDELVEVIEDLADIIIEVLSKPVSLTLLVDGEEMTTVSLDTTQKVTITAVEKDAAGNVVAPAAPLTWTSSDTNAVSLEVSADTFSAVATTVAVGASSITATDGTLNSDSVDATVTAAPAVSLTLEVGTPEPK